HRAGFASPIATSSCRSRSLPAPIARPPNYGITPGVPAGFSTRTGVGSTPCYHPRVTRRWIFEGLGQEAFERLASGLTGSELWSVLLEVMQHRAAARTPADVLAQYQRDGFCRPAAIDQRISVELDRQLLAAADGFEAIELSPVAPLAAC